MSDVGQFGKSLANDGLDNIQGSVLQRSRPAQPQIACGLIEFVVLELQLPPSWNWGTAKSVDLTLRQSGAPQPHGTVSWILHLKTIEMADLKPRLRHFGAMRGVRSEEAVVAFVDLLCGFYNRLGANGSQASV